LWISHRNADKIKMDDFQELGDQRNYFSPDDTIVDALWSAKVRKQVTGDT
jgi:hypothetical protein